MSWKHLIGHIPWNKGVHKSTNTGRTHFTSESTTGSKHWNWKGGKDALPFCNCGKQLSTRRVKTCVKCMHKGRLQENHPNWKNGISKHVHSTKEPKYKEWRTKVFTRDSFTCRIADIKCNGQLQAHHILRWADYPELRYDINNGITLCQFHHPRKKIDEAKLSPYFQSLVASSDYN